MKKPRRDSKRRRNNPAGGGSPHGLGIEYGRKLAKKMRTICTQRRELHADQD